MAAEQRSGPAADIVIVNWNTGRHLADCLRSIVRADRSRLRVARIVVVDNASTDRSCADLSTPGIPLTVVRNSRNRGFGAACNQGAAHGDGDLLLFLNPDTELYPDTLRAVGRFLRTPAARGAGICGGRMVDAHGHPAISCSRAPTLRVFFGKATGLDRLAPALFPPHHLRPAELTGSRPVDQVIGAFFLLRRTLFDRLGGFDERYFLYFEEADLARRARRSGFGSYYVHEARVHHIGQVSSAQLGGGRLRHSLCSRTQYAFRHWPRSHARLLVALTLTVELAARLVASALRANASDARATLAGYRGYLRWLLGARGRPGEPGLLPDPTAPTPPIPTESAEDTLHAHR
jgi:N-acetylglucosaminyl-diphospho-decaprenol L-rhamnosyltransferase